MYEEYFEIDSDGHAMNLNEYAAWITEGKLSTFVILLDDPIDMKKMEVPTINSTPQDFSALEKCENL